MTHASLEIIGYLAPVTQGKDVLLQLRVPAGIVAFRASQTLIVQLAKNLLVATTGAVPATPVRSRPSRVRVHTIYEKVLDAWTRGCAGCKTQFAACERYGVRYGSFSVWLFRKRKREYAPRHLSG